MVKVLRESNEIKQTPLDCIKGATLLSAIEAEDLLTREERKCRGTQKSINNGLHVYSDGDSDYWLRSAGNGNKYAYFVGFDGYVYSKYYRVSSAHVGLRPALILNLLSSDLKVGDRFKFGKYTFKVISNDLALCDVIVDACPFNIDKEDGNNYETSHIKQRVADWFREAKRNAEYKEWNVETDDEIFNGKKDEWAGW